MLATRLYSPIALAWCEVLRVPWLSLSGNARNRNLSGQTDFYNLDVIQIYVGYSIFAARTLVYLDFMSLI